MTLRKVQGAPEGPWIEVHLAEAMRKRDVNLNELSNLVGMSNVNLSRLKRGHMQSIRFETLAKICVVLECTPGDLLEAVWREPPSEDLQRAD